MIVFKNKQFVKCEEFPDTDFTGNADWVLDDNDEKDTEIEEKIISLYPNFEFVLDDDGNISDVVETEPAFIPPAPPTDHERLEALESLFSEIGSLSLLSGIKMSKFYELQVKLGKISIDNVPLRWREQVRNELEED